MDRQHRLGLIGTGSRTRSLLACLDQVGRSRVVAAADTDQGSRERALPLVPKDCRMHDDPRRVLDDPEVDLVYIGTPDHLHADLALAAMDAGKDVLCEKPMATTVQDCDRMMAGVLRTGRFLAVTMQLRYSYWAGVIGDLLRSGKLGNRTMMWCREFRDPFRRDKVGDWIVYQQNSGGPFVEKNSHHWDLFNCWAGDRALRVHAQTRNTGVHQPGDVWDCGWANVEYKGGIIANLGLSMISHHGHNLTMGIVGTDGWAEAEHTPDGGTVRMHENRDPEPKIWQADLPAAQRRLGHSGAEIPMLNQLFDTIERGDQPVTDGWWGRESVLVGVAAELSAAEGRVVEVDQVRGMSAYPTVSPFTNFDKEVSQ